MLGMGHAEWEDRIGDLMQRGVAAWEQGDPGEWRRVYNEAQALQETASEQEFSRRKLDDPAYVSQRLLSAMAFAKRLEHELADFVPSATDEVRDLQLRERDRLLGVLRDRVDQPLTQIGIDEEVSLEAARRQLDNVVSELNRIDAALEKLPSLGLPTERGR